jgi:hypothetical protein
MFKSFFLFSLLSLCSIACMSQVSKEVILLQQETGNSYSEKTAKNATNAKVNGMPVATVKSKNNKNLAQQIERQAIALSAKERSVANNENLTEDREVYVKNVEEFGIEKMYGESLELYKNTLQIIHPEKYLLTYPETKVKHEK